MEDLENDDFQPSFARPAHRKLGTPSVSYNQLADNVIIYFYGPPESTYSVPSDTDSHLMFLTHLDDHYVIGVEIENFTKSFLPQHPEMLDLARLAGVPEATVAEIESHIGAQQRTAAVVNLLREHFEGAFAHAG